MKKKKEIRFPDGSKIIYGGPCPLTVSDWMTFLTNLRRGFHEDMTKLYTEKSHSVTMSIAVGALMISVFTSAYVIHENKLLYWFSIGLSVLGSTLMGFKLAKLYSNMMEVNKWCENEIEILMNSIISGTLDTPELIREAYKQTAEDIYNVCQASIKELKLDKQRPL